MNELIFKHWGQPFCFINGWVGKFRFLIALVVSIGGLALSSSSTSAAVSKPLQVTATTTMVADLAREVGGERVVAYRLRLVSIAQGRCDFL